MNELDRIALRRLLSTGALMAATLARLADELELAEGGPVADPVERRLSESWTRQLERVRPVLEAELGLRHGPSSGSVTLRRLAEQGVTL
jgi:hypothetical protein